MLAWLAAEVWKITAYKNAEDMYIRTFQRMFGLAEGTELTSDERQQGKCFELSMGYEGGVRALLNSAKTYGVDVKKLGAGTWKVAPKSIQSQAHKNYHFAIMRKDTLPAQIGKKLWIQLEAAKLMWRSIAPETTRIWKKYNDAAIKAIENPGQVFKAGRCQFRCSEVPSTLVIRLPSSRLLLYRAPKLREDKRTGRKQISYVGLYGGRESLYGGKIAENVTQAVARDILAYAMINADRKGFPIVLHVHDEIIAECKIGSKLNLDLLCKIMKVKPAWASGLPIVAEGFEALRYRKD